MVLLDEDRLDVSGWNGHIFNLKTQTHNSVGTHPDKITMAERRERRGVVYRSMDAGQVQGSCFGKACGDTRIPDYVVSGHDDYTRC